MAHGEIEVIEYEDNAGHNAFAEWIAELDMRAFAKISAAVQRMKLGNFGDVKPVGAGVSERQINFGPGYRIYFGRDGTKLVILLGGGSKSAAATRHSRGPQSVARISRQQTSELNPMGLTRPFINSVKERADRDPEFRAVMLAEAMECFLNGEADVARLLLRDYVNATVGFQDLGTAIEIEPKSLMRMLSKAGNPRSNNLAALIAKLQEHEGVTLHVEALRN